MRNTIIFSFLIFTTHLFHKSLAEIPQQSTLVETQSLQAKEMSDIITAYGSVTPDIGSTEILNFQKGGHITKLLVSEGELVKVDTPLLELVTNPTEELNYQKAVSELTYARKELERLSALSQQNLATNSQLNAAQKALLDAEASITAQKSLGTERQKEELKAPFDGLILKIPVSQGDQVQVGSKLIELAHTDSLRVQLGVESEDCWKIKPHMKVKLTSVLDEKRSVTAEVSQVYGMINPKTQLVDVVIPLNREQSLKFIPGMILKGDIVLETAKGFIIPRQAVLEDSQGSFIFQIDGGKAKRVNVRTGIEQKGIVEIIGSFDPHKEVVVKGNYELQDGSSVRKEQK